MTAPRRTGGTSGVALFDAVDSLLEHRAIPWVAGESAFTASLGVVVQGPVLTGGPRTTAATLASVRRHLPGAVLVLSTWEGQPTAGLDVDVVVRSRDPGGLLPRRPGGKPNNVNRQLVSTRAGLAELRTTHALKLRSDSLLLNGDVVRAPASFEDRGVAHPTRVFGERVVITTHYTRYPARVDREMTYHPSDVAQFGTLRDLRELWAAPLFDDAVEALLGDRMVVAEQWYWLTCLTRAGIGAALDRRDAVRHSRSALAANFIVLSPERFGLAKETLHGSDRLSCYSHSDWLRDDSLLGGGPGTMPLQWLQRWLTARLWFERRTAPWPSRDREALPARRPGPLAPALDPERQPPAAPVLAAYDRVAR